MKTLASLAFGAIALTAASIGFAQPASARGDVGVYVGPSGIGISVETYRNYCRDRSYRRHYWEYCQRFYRGDYGAYNNGYGGDYNNGYGYGYYNDRDDRDRNHDRDRYRRHHHDSDDYRDRDDDDDDRYESDERGW